jgi:pteridine reductase
LVPLRRSGSAQDVADATAWLALDAPYTTGEVLAVDGGRGIATIEP